MGTTKTSSSVRSELLAKLASLQAEIAALTQSESRVNSEAVASLTADEWNTIRMNLVAVNKDNEPIVKDKVFVMAKGADYADYNFAKGFMKTLQARERNGQPAKLGTTVGEKSGKSQLQHAVDLIGRLIEQGFVKPDRFIKAEPKARKSRKS